MRHALLLLPMLTLAAAAAGCNEKLATGYEPNKLNAKDAERRAFYASPYSREYQEAAAEDESFYRQRRPTR